MPHTYDHAGPEPSLAEVLTDPMVWLVMKRDRVTVAQLDAAVDLGRARLGLTPVLPTVSGNWRPAAGPETWRDWPADLCCV